LTPNNRAPTPVECKACIPYLIAELKYIKPKVIVTLGLTATKSLLKNDDLRMTEMHGKAINGKAILGFNCTIVPTWHPSPVTFLHNADRKSQMIMDIRFANGLVTGNNLTSNKEKDWNSLFVTDYKTWKMFLPVLQQSDHWTIDIETTGLDGRASDAAITNIGIAPTSNFGLSVILPELSPQDKKLFLHDFKLAMEDPNIKKSGHGFKFDMKYMKEIFGFWVKGFYHDTAIGHSIIKPGDSNKLKSISWIYTPKMGGYENDLSQFGGLMKATPLQRGEYNIDDTICCRRICEIQEEKLDINKRTYLMYGISMPAYEVLGEMEYKGVAVDEYTIDRLSGEYERLLMLLKQDIYLNPNVMEYNIYHGIKFNPNSSQQLGEILFGDRYFKFESIKQTPTGDKACDKEVLKYLSDRGSKFCKQILDFHAISKLYSTYLIGIKKHIVDRRVHTNYYMDVAISGRTASSNPNCQNIPRQSNIKSIFVADKGFIFLDTDYKQMELVVSTFYTKDPIMIEAIKSGDAHTYIAKLIFGFSDPDEVKKRRDFIKTLNFGVLYGMGPYKLSQQLNITMDEGKALIEEYFKILSPTKKWLNDRRKQAEVEGYVVSKFGRIRYYKMKGTQNDGDGNSLDSSYNSAVNHPIQSVASDLMLIGLRRWRDYLVSEHLYQDRAYIALQVHDSITSCVEEKLIVELAVKKKEILESIHFPFMPVPLVVDVKIGYDWGTLKLLDI